ncbi:MAG: orotate phosphoribosyltransferase, partial [Bacteroidetes bacterium]
MSYAAYCRFLWEAGIVEVRGGPPWFVWASGRESPVYVDHRRLLAYPSWRRWVVEALGQRVGQGPPMQAVVGVATAGIPWAAWLAEKLNLPAGYVRPQPKKHGLGHQVEGLTQPVGPVLLVEDLISTGGSLLRAAQALQEAGFFVGAVAALWSYELPEAEWLPFPRYILLTFPQALLYWQEAGFLSEAAVAFLR